MKNKNEENRIKLDSKEYEFLKTNKHLGKNIVLLVLGGSHSYGTNIGGSDIDLRGIATESKKDILGFSKFEQVDNDKDVNNTDTVIYSFSKAVKLLLNSNPNVVEMLGVDEDHIIHSNRIGDELINNRKLFLSKRCIGTFGGYAYQQLNRMSNKLDAGSLDEDKRIANSLKSTIYTFNSRYSKLPEESIQIGSDPLTVDINLEGYPVRDIVGIMSEMDNIVRTYGKMNSRNSKPTEEGVNKHCMHLVRLYLTAIELLETGDIVTYRGKDLDILMPIREGKYMTSDGGYDNSFYDMLDELEERFEYASKHTELPEQPNIGRIEEFVMDTKMDIINNRGNII